MRMHAHAHEDHIRALIRIHMYSMRRKRELTARHYFTAHVLSPNSLHGPPEVLIEVPQGAGHKMGILEFE